MTHREYPDEWTVQQALQVYFNKYHFSDGGYSDKYFHIKLGRLLIPFPNTAARLKAVKMHDIHHMITEYDALWKGEIEIAGWELASGCGKYHVAWLLNSGSFIIGLFLFPSALYNGFMNGRKAKTNLYHRFEYNNQLLNTTLGNLRKSIQPDQFSRSGLMDILVFVLFGIVALAPIVLFGVLFCEFVSS